MDQKFPKGFVKKFVYVLLELVQNIERYSLRTEESNDHTLIYSDGNFFHVITENFIANDRIDKLKDRLHAINSRQSDELNKLYLESLNSEDFTEKGAGLGLIDIARKSENSLGFNFETINDKFSLYTLHVQIPVREKLNTTEVLSVYELNSFFKDKFKLIESAFYYSGDFSNKFLISLLAMFKSSKRNEKLALSSVFHHIVIELIQNVQRHGNKTEGKVPGWFSIEWLKGQTKITTCNAIPEEKIGPLERKMKMINASSDADLKALQLKVLQEEDSVGGVGLVDSSLLIRPNKMSYFIEKSPKFSYCLTLEAIINNE
ncbi:MAG: hypothetical protein IPM51_05680 [Sphingobacteriaceae bacterium]|nr:hypothetical protein [Sphingobacteriaceae bacterium]